MRKIVGSRYGLHGTEPAHSFKGLAAAAAAVAHEGRILTHIFTHLNQVIAIGHRKDLFGFRFIDLPCIAAVFGERARNVAECQAGLHGCAKLAGDAQMVIFVAAEAGADTDKIGLFNNMSCSFIVQNMVCFFCHEDRFVDKDASELCVHPKKQIFNEILLYIYILIEEFAQVFLVDIASCTHQGKLEASEEAGRICAPHGHRSRPEALFHRGGQEAFQLWLLKYPRAVQPF